MTGLVVSHGLDEDARARFVARGYRPRQFFPHRIYRLPKPGPDAAQIFPRMVGEDRAPEFWTLTLHASGAARDAFPLALFFDDDLVWHRQHYGQPGHVAYATLAADGDRLHVLNLVSDIVQRQSRAPAHRSRIQNRFNGWVHLLLNGILGFAIERRIQHIHLPRAAFVLRHTGRGRNPKPPLFERVYDAAVRDHFDVSAKGDWWVMEVAKNRDRAVPLTPRQEPLERSRRICIVHDTERGLGHVDVDQAFAARIDGPSRQHLKAMLDIERAHGWRATYSIVGLLFGEVAPEVGADGHGVCFHSYDHSIGAGRDHLRLCRKLDFRTRGYRPPRSVLTPETETPALRRFGFDWLASSAKSLGRQTPAIEDRMARIPILFDDFPLHTRQRDYAGWERDALVALAGRDVAVFGLHDCYANHWLADYPRLLDRLAATGAPATLDQVADRLFLAACV